MVKRTPFRRLEIDAEICAKLSRIIGEKRYRGSFTSFVESILENYGDGRLEEVKDRIEGEVERLEAVKGGRRVGSVTHKKIA